MAALPTGWPRGLAAPDDPEFAEAAVNWLLDRCPPEYRAHLVLRRNPRALARLAVHHCEATVEGARNSYSSARRELAGSLTPEALAEVLAALEAEGARMTSTLREVRLVDEALAGVRWTSKL